LEAATEDNKTDAVVGAKNISASQMSFNSRLDHYFKITTLLKAVGNFNPEEPEFKFDALDAYGKTLDSSNNGQMKAYAILNKAQDERNKLLYGLDGLCDLAAQVKEYIKSVFGAKSPEFKKISTIPFVKRKS